MTLRMVVLRDAQGTVHMVPNGQISTVSNMTRTWARAVVDVGVAYGTDLDRALEVFRNEAERFVQDPVWRSKFDGDPEIAGVNELDENAVTIRTLLRTHAGQQWGVAREFRRRIKNRLDQEGIEIPFPQRTMHVRMEVGGGGLVDSAARADAAAVRRPTPDAERRSPPPASSDA
jgi:small-conductance mechanosensitive channel